MESNYGMATGSYEQERDDWRSAVERARSEGWRFLELTAIRDSLLLTLREFLELGQEPLSAFERVSLHAPIRADSREVIVGRSVAPADDTGGLAAVPPAPRALRERSVDPRSRSDARCLTPAVHPPFAGQCEKVSDTFSRRSKLSNLR